MLLIVFHGTVTGKKGWMEIIISTVSGNINQILPSLHYLLKKGIEFHRETEALRMWLACSQKMSPLWKCRILWWSWQHDWHWALWSHGEGTGLGNHCLAGKSKRPLRLSFTVERAHLLILPSNEIIGKVNLGSLERLNSSQPFIPAMPQMTAIHSLVASSAINLAVQSSDIEKGSNESSLVPQFSLGSHISPDRYEIEKKGIVVPSRNLGSVYKLPSQQITLWTAQKSERTANKLA